MRWHFLSIVTILIMAGSLTMNATAAPAEKKEAVITNALAQFEPGKTSAEIKVSGAAKWSYFVYVPKSYTPDRKWPVMFIMSPGGGNPEMLMRYIDGAEMNNWILVGSVQARNEFNQFDEAIKAMVADVCKKMPVDLKRMYASGFSGGARMSFWLSEEMKSKSFAGVLACGAGGQPDKMSPKTVVFGLCGSNCFNRWDMACTLKQVKNDMSRLRFFPGNHVWAEAVYITYATTWLNACYLKGAPTSNSALVAEKKQMIAKIQTEIEKETESNPEKAYDWAVCLGIFASSPTAAGNQPMPALLKNPKIQLYAAGLKDMDVFVRKFFATDAMDSVNNNGTPAAKREAGRLAKKYAETGLAATFEKMGEPSVK
jgi:dienelactone hydrolase